jgi:carbon-monoxide dehydrogenase medium subunit
VWSGNCGFVVDEVSRRSGDFALTGAVCGVEVDGTGKVVRAAIGLFGMGPTPIRARDAESALAGSTPGDADLEEIGRLAAAACSPSDDVHASAEYRTHVGAHLVKRALDRALGEAAGE